MCFKSDDVNFIVMVLVLYNALAFGLQPAFGFFIDRFPKAIRYWKGISIASLSLALMTFVLFSVQKININMVPVIAFSCLIVAAISNAMFHVSFSKEIMANKKRYGFGIFVSSGALGIAISYWLYSIFQALIFVIPLIVMPLGFVATFMLPIYRETNGEIEAEKIFRNGSYWKSITIALCVVVVAVFLRAMMGSYLNIDLNAIHISQQNVVILSIALGAFIGKFIGGFLIDWMDEKVVLVGATLISLGCLFFLNTHILFVIIFSFSINVLMPLTLSMIKRILPSLPATGFGLLAAVLFPGVFIAFYLKSVYYSIWILLAIVIVNAAMLFLLLIFSKCFKKGIK
jgi:MFS family permease